MDPPPVTTPQARRPPNKKRISQITSEDNGDNAGVLGGSESPSAIVETTTTSASSFRNVSACNRCRTRKNKCDQKLPACTGCVKANVQCVGYDPVLKREIPRSYFFYLESRVQLLENLLQSHGILCPPADDLAISMPLQSAPEAPPMVSTGATIEADVSVKPDPLDPRLQEQSIGVSHIGARGGEVIGSQTMQGFSGPDKRAKRTAISFASIVYSAVKKSRSTGSDRGQPDHAKTTTSAGAPKDSFFGLYVPSSAAPAPFPDREVATRLVNLYFEHTNPQIPILHRGQYEGLLLRCFAKHPKTRSPRELFFLNIIFAIGSGIIMESSDTKEDDAKGSEGKDAPRRKKQKLSHEQHQPEEYHSAAIEHLGEFAASPLAIQATGHGLEELQAVLLLAGFALLRPTAPGLWYIVGVASRLAIDLGLHLEDASDNEAQTASKADIGRRQWTRDMRRRLWFCTYSFDRLVSACVGRPVSVGDAVVTAEFPSLLDDRDITPDGFNQQALSASRDTPSYKHVSYHYFRLRLLQGEILQVLQHRQARIAFASGKSHNNPWIMKNLQSPFLANYPTFRDWRIDVDRRLWEWKISAPTKAQTGVDFQPLFLEMNYWQTVVMLYRHTLSAPAQLADELDASTGEEATSPDQMETEDSADSETVYLKVAEAAQRTLRIYRQLHRIRMVNYTYLSTHSIFMCGISFLYAIWHSTVVRSKLTLDDVDFTVLCATSVLSDLVEKCPPAEACRDALKRMSKSTLSMCMSTTGFGAEAAKYLAQQSMRVPPREQYHPQQPVQQQSIHPPSQQRRPPIHFDTDFQSLFSSDEVSQRRQPNNHNRTFTDFMTELASNTSPDQPIAPQPAPTDSSWQIDPALQTPALSTSSLTQQDILQRQQSTDFDPNVYTSPGFTGTGDQTAGLDWDFGFGANGLAFDGGAGGGSWADNGAGGDMFDGFFFGSGTSGNAGGGAFP